MGLCLSKQESELTRLADLMAYETRDRTLQIEVQSAKVKELEKKLEHMTSEFRVMRNSRKTSNFNRFSYIPTDNNDFCNSTVRNHTRIHEIKL